LFVVLGYIQPEDRALSFLKYVPATEGRWEQAGQKYQRIFYGNVEAVIDGLEIVPSDYLVHDSHFDTKLLEVPHQHIADYYRPDDRLDEILHYGPEDDLEKAVVGMAEALHNQLGIPFADIGVAGSIAWRGHNPEFSDINMNVYGYDSAWNLQNNHPLACEDNKVRLRTLEEWNMGIYRVLNRIPSLTGDELRKLFERRFAFYYDNRCIGVTPVLRSHEAPITHGGESYSQITSELVQLRFHVENTDYGIFHPALLQGKSKPLEDFNDIEVTRIMLYDGAFTGLFIPGDELEVCGTLQKVLSSASDDTEFYQLMIGTKDGAGREYVHLIE
jgi:predicted nucleotidyltransferase